MPDTAGKSCEILITNEVMRACEQAVIRDGIPGFTLMKQAGSGTASIIAAENPLSSQILVVCGPGNNGGDGFIIAVELKKSGFAVSVACSAARESLNGDAFLAASLWKEDILSLENTVPEQYDIIVDALFGTGLTRDITGSANDLIERINASRKKVYAVDMPSGIDGNSGQIHGIAVQAARTVTFFSAKQGHYLYPGREYCGKLDIIDIGIPYPQDFLQTNPHLNTPSWWRLTDFSEQIHKYEKGHVLVFSGGELQTGASRLAALAALRTGAGLVTILASLEAARIQAAHLTSVMIRECTDKEDLERILQDKRFNAAVIGPGFGIGETAREYVRQLCSADLALVIDADGLSSLAQEPENLPKLFAGKKVVLTPHEGEFQRLFSSYPLSRQAGKIERARLAAKLCGSVIVYKGADTVIAALDGQVAVNINGTRHLATAGSGDVLSGCIAGLMAQNMSPFDAACAGVWLHAFAGTRRGRGLIAEDLPLEISEIMSHCVDDILNCCILTEERAQKNR